MEIFRHVLRFLGIQDSTQGSPEEVVLFSLISKFNLKNAVSFSNDKLVFDLNMAERHSPVDANVQLVKRVNQFVQHCMQNKLQLHASSLVFTFSDAKQQSTNVDAWIIFSITNGVTSLTLNFGSGSDMFIRHTKEKYIFPWRLLDKHPSLLKKLSLKSCVFHCVLTSKWTSLLALYLLDTLVQTYDIDKIVQCFPNLRILSLTLCVVPAKLTFASDSLTDLKVMFGNGLKEVEVHNCRALKKFNYYGCYLPLKMNNTTNVTSVTVVVVDDVLDRG